MLDAYLSLPGVVFFDEIGTRVRDAAGFFQQPWLLPERYFLGARACQQWRNQHFLQVGLFPDELVHLVRPQEEVL